MTTKIFEEIIQKVDLLSPEEQKLMIVFLAEKTCETKSPPLQPRRKWSDLVGLLPYPACGEDAQSYVSQIRRDADAKRENSLYRDSQ